MNRITIPSYVTEIGAKAFKGCTGNLIVNCNIPSVSSGWYGCGCESEFSSIEFGKEVTSIGDYAFYGSWPKSLIIGAGVTSIGTSAFSSPVKTIWLTNTPPTGYTYASGKINYVSNDNFSSLSNTKQYAYLSSYFDVDGVRYVPVNPSARTCDAIDCTYAPADSLYNIGKTVSYRNIAMTVSKINQYLAYQNSNVRKLSVTSDAPIGQYAFYRCNNLQTANISNSGSIGLSAFERCVNLTTCSIGDNVTSIEESAFEDCDSLFSITLGKNIASIGSHAFADCSNLQEIEIPDATTTIGEYCFASCDSLQKAIMGNGVTTIPEGLFYYCPSLSTITIGDSVTTIGDNAFSRCSALANIAIPSHVSKIDNYVFEGCSKLSGVVIADRKVALSLGKNGTDPLFSDCPLDSLYIGGKITYDTSSDAGYSPFYRNTSLRTVVITNEETEIYPNEFYGCTSLKNVKIGDGVQKIDDYAFSGCSSLDYFGFGEGLQSIGKEAFSDCSSLTRLYSEAAVPPTCGSQALEDINKWNCTLYVPKANIEAYKVADQWKDFFFIEENVEYANCIETLKDDNETEESPVLDLFGRKLQNIHKGEILIQNGKKIIKK